MFEAGPKDYNRLQGCWCSERTEMRAADPERKLLRQSRRTDPLRQTRALRAFPEQDVQARAETAEIRETRWEEAHLE